jgi:hypothetical protein
MLCSAPDASAAGVCKLSGGHGGYYYKPSVYPGYDFGGTSSYIVVRPGANCAGQSGIGNFDNAYVMIASNAPDDSPNGGWAQAGFELTNGHPLRWFSQDYATLSSILETKYSKFDITNQIGTRHAFRSFSDISCGCELMYIDSVLWASSSFDAFNNWLKPFSPQYSTEAGNYETDVPGTASAPAAYTGMGVYDELGGNNYPTPCVLSLGDDHPDRWKVSVNGCTAVNFWTG